MDEDSLNNLIQRADSGDVDAIVPLLEILQQNEEALSNAGPPLLILAVHVGETKVVQDLLALGFDPNVMSSLESTPLIAAVQSGNKEIVQLLLDHHANVNEITPNGVTALQVACKKGDYAIAEMLLKHGSDTEAAGEDGVTPLCFAFDNNDLDMARLLHTYKANPNVNLWGNPLFLFAVDALSFDFAKVLVETFHIDTNQIDRNGNTALMLATRRGYTEMVEYLLPKCNVNAIAYRGYTALAIAAATGNLNLVQKLIQHGARVEPTRAGEEAPLQAASGQGHVDIVAYLLPMIQDVNRLNADGTTALYAAVFNAHHQVVEMLCEKSNLDAVMKNGATYLCAASYAGNLEVVNTLLKNGANPNLADANGDTPLMQATHRGYVHVVKRLLQEQNRIDLDARNKNGDTALFHASTASLVKILLDAGANPSIPRRNGCTLLKKAIFQGNYEMLTYLVPLMDVNAPIMGSTALRFAVEKKSKRMVELLIENGADVNQAAENGRTALHLAAQLGAIEIIHLLLPGTKDIDTSCPDGFTAIMLAVEFGHYDAFCTLVDHGANIHHVNKNGVTLLHVACATGRLDIVKYLIDAKVNLFAIDKFGWSCFIMAVDKGHLEVVQYLNPLVHINELTISPIAPLLAAPDNSTPRAFNRGFGAIHIAYDVSDDTSMLSALLESPALNINLQDPVHQLAAFHCACAMGLSKTVEMLLAQSSLDVNQLDKDGNSGFLLACQYGKYDIVKRLLAEPRVNRTLVNKNDDSCLHLAAALYHTKVIDLLIQTSDIAAMHEINS